MTRLLGLRLCRQAVYLCMLRVLSCGDALDWATKEWQLPAVARNRGEWLTSSIAHPRLIEA